TDQKPTPPAYVIDGKTLTDGGYTEFLALLKQAPQRPLLVDRLELRDALYHPKAQQLKTRRILTSDQELAQIRKAYQESLPQGAAPGVKTLTAEERKTRNDQLWSTIPDFNLHVSH